MCSLGSGQSPFVAAYTGGVWDRWALRIPGTQSCAVLASLMSVCSLQMSDLQKPPFRILLEHVCSPCPEACFYLCLPPSNTPFATLPPDPLLPCLQPLPMLLPAHQQQVHELLPRGGLLVKRLIKHDAPADVPENTRQSSHKHTHAWIA